MKNIKIGVRIMAKETRPKRSIKRKNDSISQTPHPGFVELNRPKYNKKNLLYNILIQTYGGIPVACCPKPDCQNTNIYRKIKEIKPKYRCGKCGNKFDYPKPKLIFPEKNGLE